MDKPVSISVKTWIIRNMAVKNGMQESLIETVVNHQFESAYVALDQCNSLEFSGFGKFFFNRKKAEKKMEKFRSQLTEFERIIDDPLTTELRRRNVEMKRQSVIKNFEHLNKKLNGSIQDLRGVAQSVIPTEAVEGNDSSCESREDEDLQ